MLTHRGPGDADTAGRHQGCQLCCAPSGHPWPSNTLYRKVLSEQECGAAWTLPAAGRTWVMLVGQTGALLAWLDPYPQRGAQTCVHSSTLIFVVAAKHRANMPRFRRDSGDSQASPPYQSEEGYHTS